MTGTPLDLTPFGPLFSWLGVAYWLLAVALAAFALWVPGRWWIKAPVAVAIVAAFVYPVLTRKQEQEKQYDAAKAKLDAAMAHFEMRCKSAGEKIIRTVESVDGIAWMKWRPNEINRDDQFVLNDPYGHDCLGDECIKLLLRIVQGADLDKDIAQAYSKGYRFVETIDPSDGKRYRYRAVIKAVATRTLEQREQHKRNNGGVDGGPNVYGHALERAEIDRFTARYGVTWADTSTHEDRDHWVAGSLLQAFDLQTNEVLAERKGYLVDRGLGGRAGFRAPWLLARDAACPPLSAGTKTWVFASKVLHPTE